MKSLIEHMRDFNTRYSGWGFSEKELRIIDVCQRKFEDLGVCVDGFSKFVDEHPELAETMPSNTDMLASYWHADQSGRLTEANYYNIGRLVLMGYLFRINGNGKPHIVNDIRKLAKIKKIQVSSIIPEYAITFPLQPTSRSALFIQDTMEKYSRHCLSCENYARNCEEHEQALAIAG